MEKNIYIDIGLVFATDKTYSDPDMQNFCAIIRELCLNNGLMITVGLACLENEDIYEDLESFQSKMPLGGLELQLFHSKDRGLLGQINDFFG